MTPSDADLARAARAGRREAFEALVERHGPGLLAFLRRICRTMSDAEDLFQDSLLKAWRNLGALREPERFRAWLGRIAMNAARRQFESRRPALAHDADLADADGPDPAAAAPAEGAELGEDRARLREAIAELPPRQRAALSLRLDLGLSYAEIGEALGIREDNARAHHYQALKTLTRRLRPQAADEAGDRR